MKSINQLAELQQRFFLKEEETSYMLKDLDNGGQVSETENSNGKKRKLDDESLSQNEDAEDEEDDDDEEIFSDTDEEMRANEMKKAKKLKKVSNFNFKELKENQLEEYLEKINKSFQKYRCIHFFLYLRLIYIRFNENQFVQRNSTITKWYDKTRLSTGKSFEALEKPILQQIEHVI